MAIRLMIRISLTLLSFLFFLVINTNVGIKKRALKYFKALF